MQNLGMKLAGVVVLLLLFGWSIFPPEKNLRQGKDLRGGVTLTYAVQFQPGDNAREVMGQIIQVLKERVDPNGMYEITIIAKGNDRLEISMPLPTEDVEALRDQYDERLQALADRAFSEGALNRAVRLEEPQRSTEIERLAAGSEDRLVLLRTVVSTFDSWQTLQRDYQDAREAGIDETSDEFDQLVAAVAKAKVAYRDAVSAAMTSVIDPEEVRRVLDLPRETIRLRDGTTREYIELDSPFQVGWQRLVEDHPDAVDELQAIRDAYETYVSNRTSLDDPSDLKRLLQGAGVLEMRITVDPGDHPEEVRLRSELAEVGPGNVRSHDTKWQKIARIENWYESVQELSALQANPQGFFESQGYTVEEYNGEHYMLCWDTRDKRLTASEGNWRVSNAYEGPDDQGKPAVHFEMDATGAQLLGRVSGDNVNNKMAVTLDGQVITAPNLLSRISRSAYIKGNFSAEERRYLIRVLNAGSLRARLSAEPLAESQLGPELGADNLRAGMRAGIWALAAVSVFMVAYYFKCGMIAVVALVCNAILILGAMSLNRAAFTLPGIAGIILTFGMAVDANVLIYERIREEMRRGADLRTAVRLGYSKALSSIVDGNVTNLIVCFVLAYTGTQEIKGFAITLGIGVVCTLFSALVVTRLIFAGLLDWFNMKKLSMLPTALPPLERMLEPKINWLSKRWVFRIFSIGFVGLGLFMVATRGEKMLDTEFIGGTEITLRLKTGPDGTPMTMTREDVATRVNGIAESAPEDSPLQGLRGADVLPVNPRADGITSNEFTIKTGVTDQSDLLPEIARAFENELESKPPLEFAGMDADATSAPVREVLRPTLGEVVDRPQLGDDVASYIDGVAIVLDDLSPKPTLDGLIERLEQFRSQPDYSSTLARQREVRIIEGTPQAVDTAVVLVFDEQARFTDNPDTWRTDLAEVEWELTVGALTRTTRLASVQNFSATIAQDFQAKAIVAVVLSFLLIMIYIWVRFGSVRYSMAAIVCLLHDVLWVLGLIALAEILYDHEITQSPARALLILPFKLDLNLVAAMLTIIGYSLNDTIIIMDRIRENKGKLTYANAEVVNLSINQTISRTVITSGTTLVAVLILYIFGGEGVRSFSYALLIGVVVGTYSSIAVAAPLVWKPQGPEESDEVPVAVQPTGA